MLLVHLELLDLLGVRSPGEHQADVVREHARSHDRGLDLAQVVAVDLQAVGPRVIREPAGPPDSIHDVVGRGHHASDVLVGLAARGPGVLFGDMRHVHQSLGGQTRLAHEHAEDTAGPGAELHELVVGLIVETQRQADDEQHQADGQHDEVRNGKELLLQLLPGPLVLLDGVVSSEAPKHERGCPSIDLALVVLGDGIAQYDRGVHDRTGLAELMRQMEHRLCDVHGDLGRLELGRIGGPLVLSEEASCHLRRAGRDTHAPGVVQLTPLVALGDAHVGEDELETGHGGLTVDDGHVPVLGDVPHPDAGDFLLASLEGGLELSGVQVRVHLGGAVDELAVVIVDGVHAGTEVLSTLIGLRWCHDGLLWKGF